MTEIVWDKNARDFLRKIPKEISRRIFNKVDIEVRLNVRHYFESLANKDFYKIRVGDYRLFADYDARKDILAIRSIRHRKDAYKQ